MAKKKKKAVKKKTAKKKTVRKTAKKTTKKTAAKKTTKKRTTTKTIVRKNVVPIKRKPLHTTTKQGKPIIKYTPLSSGFMLVSIFAFLIGSIYIIPISTNYGFILSLLGILGVIASIISMTKAPEEAQLSIYAKK